MQTEEAPPRKIPGEIGEARVPEADGLDDLRKARAPGARGWKKLTAHIPPGQFLRYLVVGGWNTVFGYAVFAGFTALLMPRFRWGYMIALAISFVINITVAYAGYKFFVFKTRGNYLREWLRFMAVYGTGSLPSLLFLPFIVQALHYGFGLGRSAPYIAGAIVTGFGVLYTFFGHKKFSFRAHEKTPEDLMKADR